MGADALGGSISSHIQSQRQRRLAAARKAQQALASVATLHTATAATSSNSGSRQPLRFRFPLALPCAGGGQRCGRRVLFPAGASAAPLWSAAFCCGPPPPSSTVAASAAAASASASASAAVSSGSGSEGSSEHGSSQHLRRALASKGGRRAAPRRDKDGQRRRRARGRGRAGRAAKEGGNGADEDEDDDDDEDEDAVTVFPEELQLEAVPLVPGELVMVQCGSTSHSARLVELSEDGREAHVTYEGLPSGWDEWRPIQLLQRIDGETRGRRRRPLRRSHFAGMA